MFRRKIRNLTVILIIFAVLLLASYLFENLSKPKVITAEKIGIDKKLILKADFVEIKRANVEKLVFKKIKGIWQVNNRPADQKKVKDFLSSLSSMAVDSELGDVQGREREFSFDKLSRFEVTIKSGNRKLKLYFGKVGPTLNSRYMLVQGSEKVYLVSGTFTNDIAQQLTDWRDKKIISLEGIKEIEVISKNEKWSILFNRYSATITYRGKKLTLTGGDFERLKIDLEGVKADNFVEKPLPEQLKKFEEPDLRVVLYFKNGKRNVYFVKQDADYYLAKVEGVSWLYLVPYFNLDVFLTDPVEAYGQGQ